MQAVKISAALVALLLACAAGYVARILCRKARHKHARLDEDAEESGLPPQIVGHVQEHDGLAANPDNFIIGDDDDHEEAFGEEEEAFANYADGLDLPPQGPSVGAAGIDPGELQRYVNR